MFGMFLCLKVFGCFLLSPSELTYGWFQILCFCWWIEKHFYGIKMFLKRGGCDEFMINIFLYKNVLKVRGVSWWEVWIYNVLFALRVWKREWMLVGWLLLLPSSSNCSQWLTSSFPFHGQSSRLSWLQGERELSVGLSRERSSRTRVWSSFLGTGLIDWTVK